MSDKLFVRDIIEQVSKLDPTLPTNIVRIATGSFPDMTRVHLLDEKIDDEESLNDSIVSLKRQQRGLEQDLKMLGQKIVNERLKWEEEALAHATKIAQLTERLRRIREQARQRELPLP
jgi:hypothetical protein